MIKFFRNISKTMMAEGKTSKYFKYAIGEIILVVIGILIALQINNWNESRKERVKEREILLALADNLENNIQTLESDMIFLHDHGESSKIILSTLNNKLPYSDSLDIHFHKARVSKRELILSESGYEQYKNAGFQIIQNVGLKNEILNLFESTYPKVLANRGHINKIYDAFFNYHVPLFIFTSGENDNDWNPKLKPINFQELYDDQYYIGWIRAYYEGRKSLINLESNLLNETNRVLQVINDELKRLAK
jgi:hypothetical protein